MNEMVKRLILKDWYFHRWTIVGYLAGGAVGLFLLAAGSEGAFFAGSVLLLTVLISLGIHLVMATVITERTEHTLPFVMSLPISAREYTTSKVLANILIFLVPWTAVVLGTFAVIAGSAVIPDGLIPFAALLLVELFASYVLILSVALVSESQGWTIVVMVVSNLFVQWFMYAVSHMPSIASTMKGPSIVWSSSALMLMLTELGAIALCLGLTFYFQSRKRDFI